MDKRAEGLRLLAEAARQNAAGGANARQAHADLMQACRALLDGFRLEFDVPGVRYWEVYNDPEAPPLFRQHLTTFVREVDDMDVMRRSDPAELDRALFFIRQGARPDHHEDIL